MASTASVNFITQLYETVLLRAGSASDIDGWASELDGGVLTQANAITDFVGSTEAITDVLPIVRLYQTFFNRAPDAAGLNFWVNALRNSGAAGSAAYNSELQTIATSFAGSAESQHLYGANPAPTAFVATLYQDVLGRSPDQAGDTFWVNYLNSAGNTAAAEATVALAFANSQEFVTDSNGPIDAFLAAAALSGSYATGVIAGMPNANSGHLASDTFLLTPGVDNVIGVAGAQNTFEASLTPFNTDGKGPTLNSTDTITGGGGNNNTLLISDDFGAGQDIIPLGTHISNIQTVSLQTSGNAGSTGGTPFDTSGISGVTTLTVTSSGNGEDNINAAGTTAITVNQHSTGGDAGVFITGGSTVTVNAAGDDGVTVGTGITAQDPTGAVNITASNIDDPYVTVFGGTDVTVQLTSSHNDGQVAIGGDDGQFALPTGNVTVTDAGNGHIDVFGGVNVAITTASQGNGDILVGDQSTAAHDPSGTVTINDTAPIAYDSLGGIGHNDNANIIQVFGGTDVSVTTNAGAVRIGGEIEGAAVGDTPTGAVTVVSTATILNPFSSSSTSGNLHAVDISVDGGTSVTVTAANANVSIGQSAGDLGSTMLPTGVISVTESKSITFANDTSSTSGQSYMTSVAIDGGTSVTVSAQGQDVVIGEHTAPTGDVTVTQSAVLTGIGLGELFTSSGFGGGYVLVGGGASVSVTTTGGSVQVGLDNEDNQVGVTGAVTVTDTFSGDNADSIAVFGGTTVTINTTPTDGANRTFGGDNDGSYGIQVGSFPDLNATNTALTNANLDPTGNVVINNSETFGTVTTYGTAGTDVFTDGGSSVSVTGGIVGTIMDAQATVIASGINAGKALGTSTLTTVVLDHALAGSGDATKIFSDAVTSLTVIDDSAGEEVSVNNHTAGYSLSLTVGNDAGFLIADNDQTDGESNTNTLGSITIGDNGKVSTDGANHVVLNSSSMTSATFTNTVSLKMVFDGDTALTSITATGSGALSLGDVTNLTKLATIDVSASSGATSVTLDPTVTSFKGGTGNDTVTINGNSLINGVTTVSDTLIGGSGANTLVANYIASLGDSPLGNNANIKNFQTLALGSHADSSAGDLANGIYTAGATFYDASGFSSLKLGAVSNAVTFLNVGAATTLAITGAPGFTVNYVLQNSGGPSDALGLSVGVDGTSTTGTGTLAATVAAPGVETVNLTSLGFNSSTNTGNTVTLDDATAKKITVAGDQVSTLVLNDDTGNANTITSANSHVTSISVTGTGATNVNGVALAAAGGTVTGGAGKLTAAGVGGAAHVDTVTIGGTTASAGELFKEDINGTTYTYAAGAGDTTATVAAGLVAQIGAPANVTVTYVGGASSFTLTDTAGQLDATSSTNSATVTEATSSVGSAAVDSITTGAGGGAITIGNGGSWNGNLNTGKGAYDVGSETINLAASAAVADTLTVNTGSVTTFNGSVGGVTGFNVTTSAKTSDVLTFGAGKTALANNGSSTSVSDVNGYAAILLTGGTNLTNLTWSSSNGVITFSASGNHNISEFSTAQLIAAAEIIVDDAGANTVAAFAAGGNTFVVSSSGNDDGTAANTLPGNSVTELLGVTGIAGFGSTAAVGTLVSTNETNLAPLANVGNQGSTTQATATFDDTGYSRDTFNTGTTGVTNTFNHLAASAQLDISNGANIDLGNLAVGLQAGASGSNSLTLNFTSNTITLDTVTLTGDDTLSITGAGSSILKSLVDASNTIATITHSGAGGLEIDGVTDTALTTVDVSKALGGDTLTISQAGVTIKPETGGNGTVIVASGAGDIISQSTTGTSAVTLVANGAGDVVTLGNGNNNVINAFGTGHSNVNLGGAGDTITVGTGGNTIIASGAGDTINVAHSIGNSNAITVGSNATLNLGSATFGTDTNQHIIVTGDVTGATASGTFAMTTINFAADDANNTITFGNAGHEFLVGDQGVPGAQVNVATATSLANALDIAASQGAAWQGGHQQGNSGAIDWFQYGGNTYIVEAVNTPNSEATHTALGVGDLVVKLTGIVDIDHNGGFSGGVLTL